MGSGLSGSGAMCGCSEESIHGDEAAKSRGKLDKHSSADMTEVAASSVSDPESMGDDRSIESATASVSMNGIASVLLNAAHDMDTVTLENPAFSDPYGMYDRSRVTVPDQEISDKTALLSEQGTPGLGTVAEEQKENYDVQAAVVGAVVKRSSMSGSGIEGVPYIKQVSAQSDQSLDSQSVAETPGTLGAIMSGILIGTGHTSMGDVTITPSISPGVGPGTPSFTPAIRTFGSVDSVGDHNAVSPVLPLQPVKSDTAPTAAEPSVSAGAGGGGGQDQFLASDFIMKARDQKSRSLVRPGSALMWDESALDMQQAEMMMAIQEQKMQQAAMTEPDQKQMPVMHFQSDTMDLASSSDDEDEDEGGDDALAKLRGKLEKAEANPSATQSASYVDTSIDYDSAAPSRDIEEDESSSSSDSESESSDATK